MKDKLPQHFREFQRDNADIAKAFEELGRRIHETGSLPERERRLVKLGIAIGVNSEGAVHSAVRQALRAGCSPDDVQHAVRLAITTLGWPRAQAAMTWVEDVLAEVAGKP